MIPRLLQIAKSPLEDHFLDLLPAMANRHGLIAGATGTGKTVTLQVLAEQFSRLGVPVFLSDVKGDLTGLSQPGDPNNAKVNERVAQLGLTDFFVRASCPVRLWDVFGEQGHPMRATISDMGPLLLTRLLGLNDTQAGVLTLAFRVADDNQWYLDDLKDLRAMVQYVGDNAKDLKTTYGNISPASVGAIQRALLTLEEQGAEKLFGMPELEFVVYSMFLFRLLLQLCKDLPEVGNQEKPRLVFFFDEAHMLFDDAPKVLVDKIEQVLRLIRSKGVGIYFATHSPTDLPERVLAQLGNRIQHALSAFSLSDPKAVKALAGTFRNSPKLNIVDTITGLADGEALISFLDAKGVPGIVQRAFICPPGSKIGPVSPTERTGLIKNSSVYGKYEITLDRESAYEILKKRSLDAETEAQQIQVQSELDKDLARQAKERAAREAELDKEMARLEKGQSRKPATKPTSPAEDVFTSFAKNAARSLGTDFGKSISRGILGSWLKPAKGKGSR